LHAQHGGGHGKPDHALSAGLWRADTLKFFGCELGAQTNFDKSVGTSIVNGAHDQKKLSECRLRLGKPLGSVA
jgi:hypothetical protein